LFTWRIGSEPTRPFLTVPYQASLCHWPAVALKRARAPEERTKKKGVDKTNPNDHVVRDRTVTLSQKWTQHHRRLRAPAWCAGRQPCIMSAIEIIRRSLRRVPALYCSVTAPAGARAGADKVWWPEASEVPSLETYHTSSLALLDRTGPAPFFPRGLVRPCPCQLRANRSSVK